MITIEKIRKVLGYEDGVQIAVCDLNVSTSGELPDLGDIVEGTKIAANSIANITQTGKWMKVDTDGGWYYQGGGSAPESEDDAEEG